MNSPTQVPSKKLVVVDGELKPGDIDAPRLVLIRKLNSRGEPVGDFAYVAYWATDGNPAEQDQHAELIAAAVNGWQPLHDEIESLQHRLSVAYARKCELNEELNALRAANRASKTKRADCVCDDETPCPHPSKCNAQGEESAP